MAKGTELLGSGFMQTGEAVEQQGNQKNGRWTLMVVGIICLGVLTLTNLGVNLYMLGALNTATNIIENDRRRIEIIEQQVGDLRERSIKRDP